MHLIGSLPEWPAVSIRDLCAKVTSGGTPSRKEPSFYSTSGVPWLKTQEIRDQVVWDAEEYISEAGLAQSSAKLLPANTVLVAMYGATAGKLAILGAPMACNQACCALIVDPARADYRFLYYSLLAGRDALISMANGAAQQNLSVGVIANASISVPPLAEQKAITALLGALDDKIAVNERIASTALALAQAEFRRETVGSPEHKLEEIAAITMGSSPPGETYNDHGEGLPFYQGVRDFGMRHPSARVWCSEPVRLAGTKDVLISVRAPVGRINVSAEACCIGRGLAAARSTAEAPDLLYHSVVAAEAAWSPFESEGTVFGAINKNQLQNVAVKWPDDGAAAARLNLRLASLDNCADSALTQNRALAELRDTLLPKLISGELRIKDAEKLVSETV
ncbi:restriction endonuclease subunit S [Micromonospora noduli]|uniref:restriction endonuclease subunit S n=1 Tax=Micromonospora noduli TaxID=709876 RepID=UPI0034261CA6